MDNLDLGVWVESASAATLDDVKVDNVKVILVRLLGGQVLIFSVVVHSSMLTTRHNLHVCCRTTTCPAL